MQIEQVKKVRAHRYCKFFEKHMSEEIAYLAAEAALLHRYGHVFAKKFKPNMPPKLALYHAFAWDSTDLGYYFWSAVYTELVEAEKRSQSAQR